jgi:DNA mismatch repair protein MutS
VPNNTDLSSNQTQLIILTGPNMAGKSVYIRQVALIVLLNQIGSFVPATSARLGIVDRIFVRSGASDMISEGLSTFMVEMVETAQILDQATSKSLVIMDEIGRGTSTYDGISIAWAIAEYIVSNPNMRPKTLFATHYHELQELETKYPARIKNYHMAVEEEEHNLVFLYTLLPEGASHSFGIAVAQLAGIPRQVIETAYGELSRLESGVQRAKSSNDIHTNIKKNKKTEEVIELVRKLDSNNMTPMEALTFLNQLQKKVL